LEGIVDCTRQGSDISYVVTGTTTCPFSSNTTMMCRLCGTWQKRNLGHYSCPLHAYRDAAKHGRTRPWSGRVPRHARHARHAQRCRLAWGSQTNCIHRTATTSSRVLHSVAVLMQSVQAQYVRIFSAFGPALPTTALPQRDDPLRAGRPKTARSRGLREPRPAWPRSWPAATAAGCWRSTHTTQARWPR